MRKVHWHSENKPDVALCQGRYIVTPCTTPGWVLGVSAAVQLIVGIVSIWMLIVIQIYCGWPHFSGQPKLALLGWWKDSWGVWCETFTVKGFVEKLNWLSFEVRADRVCATSCTVEWRECRLCTIVACVAWYWDKSCQTNCIWAFISSSSWDYCCIIASWSPMVDVSEDWSVVAVAREVMVGCLTGMTWGLRSMCGVGITVRARSLAGVDSAWWILAARRQLCCVL